MIIRFESADGLSLEENVGETNFNVAEHIIRPIVLNEAVRPADLFTVNLDDFGMPELYVPPTTSRKYRFDTVLEYTMDLRWKKVLYKEVL